VGNTSKPTRAAFIETRARDELRQQAKFVEKRRKGHGALLLNNVKAAITDILNPDIQWGFYLDEISEPQFYERHVSRFPMKVVYFTRDNDVYIVAIASEAREPGYWKSRINDAGYFRYR